MIGCRGRGDWIERLCRSQLSINWSWWTTWVPWILGSVSRSRTSCASPDSRIVKRKCWKNWIYQILMISMLIKLFSQTNTITLLNKCSPFYMVINLSSKKSTQELCKFKELKLNFPGENPSQRISLLNFNFHLWKIVRKYQWRVEIQVYKDHNHIKILKTLTRYLIKIHRWKFSHTKLQE